MIGNVDNMLRPILVGLETKLPDARVLLTTLRSLSAFGFNGFIIGPIAAALILARENGSGAAARHPRDGERAIVAAATRH